MAKKIKNFRMTEEGIAILAALADKKGVSEASVVEMLVRDEASRINVSVPKPGNPGKGGGNEHHRP